MKRFHVHVAVPDLNDGIRFYSTLFGAEPSVVKPDYAKWMLDDPRVNFAISARGAAAGLDHLGIQVETADELHDIHARLQRAERPVLREGATTCCYAKSEKAWISERRIPNVADISRKPPPRESMSLRKSADRLRDGR